MSAAAPKKILLGVSGSIAAYKACEIVRALVKGGAEVRCMATPNGARFVSTLALATLSRSPVAVGMFVDPSLWDMAHISLAAWAQRIAVAPASASIISRLARGDASGVIESVVLAARCPVALAPAMDAEMWQHPATQANVEQLRKYGYEIWGPEHGELASGRVGLGRMMEPEEIARRLLA
ncbi:MAG: phosphopantothenoylcysteine decarboxylase [Elusimicrobia bacterium]|nr:phosphopantothenoylcysteine decarboxylase [Elusimicrobiota bacterium]